MLFSCFFCFSRVLAGLRGVTNPWCFGSFSLAFTSTLRNGRSGEYYTDEHQSRDSNHRAMNTRSMRTNFCAFRGRYDRQRTLVIRVAAMKFASESAITLARDQCCNRSRKHQDSWNTFGGELRRAFQKLRFKFRVSSLIFHSLVFWFSLVFYNQGISLVFRVFFSCFPLFSRVFTGVARGKKSFVFWVVFLGFYLDTKEWKIRVFLVFAESL